MLETHGKKKLKWSKALDFVVEKVKHFFFSITQGKRSKLYGKGQKLLETHGKKVEIVKGT